MFILRQSTAVDVLIGPFVDGTDGATPEEALSPSVQLSKNGQTAATKNDVTTPTHDNAGYYNCEFDATDTGTVGQLVAFIEGSTGTFLQVRHEFQIMDTAAFDALFADGAEGPLQATTVGRTLDIAATGEVALDFGATIGTLDAAQFGADFLTSAKIADNAFLAVNFAANSLDGKGDWNIGKTGYSLTQSFPTNFADMAITVTTGLVSVGTMSANVIDAASIAASAMDGKGDWNIGKTGYSLTQAFPTNFADMSIVITTGLVDITQAAADKAWLTTTRQLTALQANIIAATSFAAGAIDSAAIAADAIGASELATDAIGDAQIATGAIASTAFAAGAIDAAAIANAAIDAATFAADAIDATAIAANAIGASELATDAIGDAQIATAAIASTAFAAGAIDAAAIAADAIGASELATDAIGAAQLATDAVDEIRDAILPTQNVAFNNIEFLFVAASDHVTPVTGATGTSVTRSIDGGAFGAGTGTLAEVGNGIYQYDASAADMNGGIITFRFIGTGGTPGAPDDRFLTIVTGGGV